MQKRRVFFSPVGLLYLLVPAIVLTGAILREINILVLLAGFMLWPMVISWGAVAGSMRGVRLRRKLPSGVFAGDEFHVEVTLQNTRYWGASRAIAVEDCVWREGSDAAPLRPSVLFSRVGAGDSASGYYHGRLPRRGRYVFGPIRAVTEYPLGLVRGAVTLDRRERFMVFPKLGKLTENWEKLRREQFLGSRRSRRQASLMEGDFFGLREWRPGDSRRWIHWRTTARRGDLSVRQFEQPRSQDMSIWLELRSARSPTSLNAEHVEQAVSFATTIVARLCERGGSQITLAVAGREVTIARGSASRTLLQEALEVLTLAEAGEQDRLDELVEKVLPTVRAGMMCFLISTATLDAQRVRKVREAFHGRMSGRSAEIRIISVPSGELTPYFIG